MKTGKAKSIALLAGLAALTSCTPGIRAGADFAPDLDFSGMTTYTWDEPDTRPVGDPRLESNPFFEARLHDAIERELAARGFRQAASGGGMIVHHHATVRDHVEVYEADREAGYTTPEYGAGTQVLQYPEGTLLVDIADASSKELVWRGWAQFDIGRALEDPELMSAQIDEAIAKMFESFPVAPR